MDRPSLRTSILRDLRTVWRERRVRFPAFIAAAKQLPAKVRNADPVQRRNLALAMVVFVMMILVNFF